LGVVVFDLFYTVFLNTISFEITPFNLSVCVVLAVGIGVGVGEAVKWCEGRAAGVVGVLKVGCGVVPLIFMVLNYRAADQSENTTAYEHALNIFRTADPGAVVFIEGDNHFFPVLQVFRLLISKGRREKQVSLNMHLLRDLKIQRHYQYPQIP